MVITTSVDEGRTEGVAARRVVAVAVRREAAGQASKPGLPLAMT